MATTTNIMESAAFFDDSIHFETVPEPAKDEKLSDLMQATLAAKVEKKEDIESVRKTLWGRFNLLDLDADAWLIGGDFFSMGFLGFQAAQCFLTALATNAVVQRCTLGFGIVGGVVNIAVGLSCLIQGVKDLSKGHKVDGFRLLYDGILMLIIGSLMIVGPILLKVAAGAAFTTILTNPFVLPVLFALLSAFITYEILKKVAPMWMGTDLGTQLMNQLKLGIEDQKSVQKLLNTFLSTEFEDEKTGKIRTYSFDDMQQLFESGEHEKVKKILCAKMNQFEEKVGVKAAIEMFQLMETLLELQTAQDYKTTLENSEKAYLESIDEMESLLCDLIGDNGAGQALRELENGKSVDIASIVQQFSTISSEIARTIATHPELESTDSQIVTAQKIYRCLFNIQTYKGEIKYVRSEQVRNAAQIVGKKEEVEGQKPALQKFFKDWKVAQHVRLAQQAFYIGASAATFGTFAPKAPANLINGIVNSFMAIANAIPLYMDVFWPYRRNVPVIVPGVNPEEIDGQLERQRLSSS